MPPAHSQPEQLFNFWDPWTGGTISISLHTFELPITNTIIKTQHHSRSRKIMINIHFLLLSPSLTFNATIVIQSNQATFEAQFGKNMALCSGTPFLLGHHCFAGRWPYAFLMFKLFDVLSEWYGSLWECSNCSIEHTLMSILNISMVFLFQLFPSRDILESIQYSTDDCPQLCNNSQCILSPQCPRNFISSFLSALSGLTDLLIIHLHFWWKYHDVVKYFIL